MAVSPMQIVVSSCVAFLSYISERAGFSVINSCRLSLPLPGPDSHFLWLSPAASLDLSLCFVSFPSFPTTAYCFTLPTLSGAPARSLARPLSVPVNCLSLCCHTYSYKHTHAHTQTSVNPKEKHSAARAV